jgi:hypothetical protein
MITVVSITPQGDGVFVLGLSDFTSVRVDVLRHEGDVTVSR